MKINHKKYKGFVFDGCHKFYLIPKNMENKELEKWNWNKREIRPLKKLTTKLWQSACPLKFIQIFDDKYTDIIKQGSKVKTIKII
jgi:hypothetical protein